MIIWGFRVIWRAIADGVFHCPQEDRDQPYKLKRAQRFFTLFFIPLIPLKKMGEAVECQGCKTKFEKSVLDRPTADQMGERLGEAARVGVVALLRIDAPAAASAREEALRVVTDLSNAPYDDTQLNSDIGLLPTHDVIGAVQKAALFLSEPGRERLLSGCVRVAIADGPMTGNERRVIDTIGGALSMTAAHVQGVVATTESERA